MLFIFSAPVLIGHLWQHKTVVFLHRCLLPAVILRQNKSMFSYQFLIVSHIQTVADRTKPGPSFKLYKMVNT